jgi:Domain of unknown function (DUF397)
VIDFSRATWRTSTKSQQSGQCVELTKVAGAIGVRDSKDPNGPILVFTVEEFAAFLDGATKGEFDALL